MSARQYLELLFYILAQIISSWTVHLLFFNMSCLHVIQIQQHGDSCWLIKFIVSTVLYSQSSCLKDDFQWNEHHEFKKRLFCLQRKRGRNAKNSNYSSNSSSNNSRFSSRHHRWDPEFLALFPHVLSGQHLQTCRQHLRLASPVTLQVSLKHVTQQILRKWYIYPSLETRVFPFSSESKCTLTFS